MHVSCDETTNQWPVLFHITLEVFEELFFRKMVEALTKMAAAI